MAHTNEWVQFLSNHTAGELVAQKIVLVEMPVASTVRQCLDTLNHFHILALPIYAPEGRFLAAGGVEATTSDHKQYIGIVSVTDIVVYLASATSAEDEAHRLQSNILSVIGTTEEGQSLWVCEAERNLYYTFEPLSKHVHRMLVPRRTEEGGVSFSLLTQTDAVEFILQHSDVFRSGLFLTVEHVLREIRSNAIGASVVSLPRTAAAIDGYRMMHSAGVTAVPIVDEHNRVVGTLSDSDLRGATHLAIEAMRQPVLEYLHDVHREVRQPLVCTRHTTIGRVVELVTHYKVHRLWVVENDTSNVLEDVISLTDILRVFAPY